MDLGWLSLEIRRCAVSLWTLSLSLLRYRQGLGGQSKDLFFGKSWFCGHLAALLAFSDGAVYDSAVLLARIDRAHLRHLRDGRT